MEGRNSSQESDPDTLGNYAFETFRFSKKIVQCAHLDTTPGRQSMAACYFLQKRFSDALVYLSSIEVSVDGKKLSFGRSSSDVLL